MIDTKSYQVEPTITIGGIKFRRISNECVIFEHASNECYGIKKDAEINADDVEFTVTKQENNN